MALAIIAPRPTETPHSASSSNSPTARPKRELNHEAPPPPSSETVLHAGSSPPNSIMPKQDQEAAAGEQATRRVTWLHIGYHLTTGTAGASTPNLPSAMASLGWELGVFFLFFFAISSFYAYYILILVLDRMEKQGRRCLRYQDATSQILGVKWSKYVVAPAQYIVCLTTVISFVLLGGESLKALCYGVAHNEKITLAMYVSIFGVFSTIVSQLPTFHSLRHLNLLSLLFSLVYTILLVLGSTIAGYSKQKPLANYSLVGTTSQKVMSAFNAFSMLSTSYGNAILVETQATLSPPIGLNMTKGLILCSIVTIFNFFPVALVGYWAFGNLSNGNILLSMKSWSGESYVPDWIFVCANICMLMQLLAGSVLYSQPSFEVFERRFRLSRKGNEILGTFITKILPRTIFMLIATLLAAMLPFFSDINAIVGSLGYTPLVFIFPMALYISCFKINLCTKEYWLRSSFLSFFLVITLIASFTSIHQLVMDENTYKLFANL